MQTSARFRTSSEVSAACVPPAGPIEATMTQSRDEESAGVPSLGSLLAMVMKAVNERIEAVESVSNNSRAALEELRNETVKLKDFQEVGSRKLDEINDRLQHLSVNVRQDTRDPHAVTGIVPQGGVSPSPTKRKEGFATADAILGETFKPEESKACKLTPNPFTNFSFMSYVQGELKKGVYPETEEKKYAMQEGKVKGLFYTPIELEKFMLYGLLHCFDCFLYLYTLLPIRVLIALFVGVKQFFIGSFLGRDGRLTSSQWLDLIRFLIILPTIAFFYYLDTSVLNSSVLYHLIRTQTFVKLYFLYNMIDICDRLFSSVGQDLFDAIIYYVAVRKKPRWAMTVLVYAPSLAVQALHCALTMLQYTILLVAFNSHNKVLLVLMLSNNFGELKSTVFKRFSSHNLFQMSCADVRERFQYILLLVLVLVRVMEAYHWDPEKMGIFLQDAIVILVIEVLIDWIKQCFITKFNDISYEAYAEYTRSLAYDLLHLGPAQQREHFDHICRRMGLTPVPMACIFTSVLLKTVPWKTYHLVLLFPVLLALKLGCHLLLLQQSFSKVHAHELKEHETCRSAHMDDHHSLQQMARRSHRRTRSHFDLPLRRNRFEHVNSENSGANLDTSCSFSYRCSDSESEPAVCGHLLVSTGGDQGVGVAAIFDEAPGGEAELPGPPLLNQAKRSKSLSQVRLGDMFDPGPGGQEPPAECELRCRARTVSTHGDCGSPGTDGAGGPGQMVSGPGAELTPGEAAAEEAEGGGMPASPQIPLSDVNRYSMCSSQIV